MCFGQFINKTRGKLMNTQELITFAQAFDKPVIENNRIEDADGNLMRLDKVNPFDMEKDQMVRRLAQEAIVLAEDLHDLKMRVAQQLQDFVQKMAETYDKKMGGKQGNLTMFTYDRRFKIKRSVQKREAANERIVVVREMIDDCIKKWSKGANKNLQVLVDKYFKTDKDGNYNIKLLRSLKREPVGQDDEEWLKAMKALDDAIDVVSSAIYYQVSVRDENGVYHNIPLAITEV